MFFPRLCLFSIGALLLGVSPGLCDDEAQTPNSWTVENCIILQFNSSRFTLHPSHNTSLVVDIPSNATVVKDQSHCGNETQVISLTWKWVNVNGSSLTQNITVEFGTNNDTKAYAIKDIYGTFYVGQWNESRTVHNKTENVTVSSFIYMATNDKSKPFLSTPLGRSYVCVDPGNVTLDSQYKVSDHSRYYPLNNTSLAVRGLKFDAFRDSKTPSGKLQNPFNCMENRVNVIVPIVVGCVLAFLIVFVVVAYLLGRRRPRSGYMGV